MKQKNFARTLVAALLTLAASAAYGQDRETTAKIPFAFRAVGSDLPAGQYKVVRPTGNSANMRLQNMVTGKSVFIHARTSITDSNDVRARLVFKCAGDEGCALASIWEGRRQRAGVSHATAHSQPEGAPRDRLSGPLSGQVNLAGQRGQAAGIATGPGDVLRRDGVGNAADT
jgi:hypothetical protein